jgi:hypothetical protein
MDERDSIKATPQSPVMGLFAGGLQGLDGLLNRSGIDGLSGALGVPAAARLFENMSYGSPPYSGTGMATRLSPDIAATAGGVLGLGAGIPARMAAKVGTGALGMGLVENQSLDSVIQQMLNRLGQQNK